MGKAKMSANEAQLLSALDHDMANLRQMILRDVEESGGETVAWFAGQLTRMIEALNEATEVGSDDAWQVVVAAWREMDAERQAAFLYYALPMANIAFARFITEDLQKMRAGGEEAEP